MGNMSLKVLEKSLNFLFKTGMNPVLRSPIIQKEQTGHAPTFFLLTNPNSTTSRGGVWGLGPQLIIIRLAKLRPSGQGKIIFIRPGVRFSKAPIINGPVKLLLFKWKIEV